MYCTVCNKYRIFEKKKSNIFKRTLSLSVIYSKCGPEYEKIFKEEESSKIFKKFLFN